MGILCAYMFLCNVLHFLFSICEHCITKKGDENSQIDEIVEVSMARKVHMKKRSSSLMPNFRLSQEWSQSQTCVMQKQQGNVYRSVQNQNTTNDENRASEKGVRFR